MDLNTFIVSVFTFIDDWFQQQSFRLRQRGPQPTLADSEVLTIEVVGAFLGISTDMGAFEYFRRHWQPYFPKLGAIQRTTYVRQSANLWHIKALLWRAAEADSFRPRLFRCGSYACARLPLCPRHLLSSPAPRLGLWS